MNQGGGNRYWKIRRQTKDSQPLRTRNNIFLINNETRCFPLLIIIALEISQIKFYMVASSNLR